MIILNFIVYDIATGGVKRLVACEELLLEINAGEAYIEGHCDHATDYVPNGVVTARPANPSVIDTAAILADGVETATVTGIPNPSTVSFRGPEVIPSMEVTDGTLAFDTDEPGTYTITITPFPELPKGFTVVAS